MFFRLCLACIILSISSLTGCAPIPPGGSGSIAVENRNMRLEIAFSERDRERIRNYYKHEHHRRKSEKMPPGLAKRQHLPPGLQRHITKHGQLPPGLQGRSLPHELDRELSPLPKGFVRVKIGADIVLLDERTRVAVDVVWDVD